MSRSIRVRLMVWALAVLLPLWIGGGWLLLQVFGNRLLHDIDVVLQEEAETIAELLTTAASADAIQDLLMHIAAETAGGPHKYITVARGAQLIAAAPGDAPAVLARPDPALRVIRYQSPDGAVTVAIGASAAAALHAKEQLTSLLVIGLPVVLVLLASGLWLVVDRALRPLEKAARQLDNVGAASLDVRIPTDNRADEVGRMVAVLNRMLDRLQRVVAELQRFTADAAHELRTPLTVLRAGLEVALTRDRSAAEYQAALREALAETDRLCRLAEDLLTLARLEASGTPRNVGLVDIGEMLRELADAAASAAGGQHVTIQVEAPAGLQVRGNAGDLYRLFANLIDNAVQYGQRAGEGASFPHLMLSARTAADGVAVTISDDGPGIPPGELSRVFDRFYRGNGNHQRLPGSGLGLSIAQEIARTHGGRITFADAGASGCVVQVNLPAADAGLAAC